VSHAALERRAVSRHGELGANLVSKVWYTGNACRGNACRVTALTRRGVCGIPDGGRAIQHTSAPVSGAGCGCMREH